MLERMQMLITGGSGFLGAHCVARALDAGHDVRATVRSLRREDDVRSMVVAAQADDARLTVVAADLTADAGWDAAAEGCDVVLHVASPFPAGEPDDADELIVPAREGTRRVLQSASRAGAGRVVVTSSFAAIGYGRAPSEHIFTEVDWTDVDAGVPAYVASKTLAERAAWEIAGAEDLELVVINPTGIFGPVLGRDHSSSTQIISALLAGDLRDGAPPIAFGVVDVRDAADLHLIAADHRAAAGERFLAAAGDAVTINDVLGWLHTRLGEDASEVPNTTLEGDIHIRHLNPEKARRVLGWTPRSSEDAIIATARSLLELDLG